MHRHRLAPHIAGRVTAAQDRGQLIVRRGWIRSIERNAQGLAVTFRPRGGPGTETIDVARVINCSGPASDYTRLAAPLVRDLLADGLVRPDPLRLGLDVAADCALVDAAGRRSKRLYAVGPVTKGSFWEITAVPDIRTQCARLAETMLAGWDPPGDGAAAEPRGAALTHGQAR